MKQINSRPYNQLARYLCASVTAYHLGIGLSYALKKYVPDEVGEFWHAAAEAMSRDAMNATHNNLDEADFIAAAQGARATSPWMN